MRGRRGGGLFVFLTVTILCYMSEQYYSVYVHKDYDVGFMRLHGIICCTRVSVLVIFIYQNYLYLHCSNIFQCIPSILQTSHMYITKKIKILSDKVCYAVYHPF